VRYRLTFYTLFTLISVFEGSLYESVYGLLTVPFTKDDDIGYTNRPLLVFRDHMTSSFKSNEYKDKAADPHLLVLCFQANCSPQFEKRV